MGSSLAIVRSLGSQGWNVEISSPTTHGIASYSRFAAHKSTYANPMTSEAEFLSWMETIIANDAYALIIPVTERTLIPLMKIRHKKGAEKLAMASNKALESVLDKGKTTALAQSLNIPLPEALTITNQADMQKFIADGGLKKSSTMEGPMVIKPGRSIGQGKDGPRKLEVQYAFNLEEAQNQIDAFLNFGDVIVQDYFQGQGVGVELLAADGEIQYAFQHLRIHELPVTGGASCLRKSMPIEPVLFEAAQKLMKALHWTGVAMVEFKWNPTTRAFVLVEINGRFWGSLPLAVAAGADFPAMLVELLVEGKIQQRMPYHEHFYARNLSTDLQWYELVLRHQTPEKFEGVWQNKSRILIDLLRVFTLNHRFDIQSFNDPTPGIKDLVRISREYIKRIKGILQARKQFRFHKAFWTSGAAQKRIRDAKKIAFICYGNINRSALCERYFLKAYPQSPVEVVSAGFHPQIGRSADPVMVQETKALGIDMEEWSSQKATKEMLQSSDVIFVMEHTHWQRIQNEFPNVSAKTYLLSFAGKAIVSNGEIEDPYAKSRKIYRKCISEVCSSIDGLINIMKK
ncbi:MAG: ATP-grasp domain-containing protein [Bacillota bacterium]